MPIIETKGAASAQGYGEFAKKSGEATYVEDVFSTYLYTGNGTSQLITNGIQLGSGAANGTIIQLTGDNLTDSSPVPYTMTNSGTSVSTSVKKYGTGSIEISNTNNYLYTSGNLNLGGSDFTAECWVNFGAFGNWAGAPFSIGNPVWASANSLCPLFGATMLQVSIGGTWYGTSIPNHGFTAGVWHHFCIQRNGNNWYFYRDGTQIGSTISNSTSLSAAGFYINGNTAQGNLIPNTYVDDVRVSLGNKYPLTGFTPPTSALPLDTLVTGKGGLTWIKNRGAAQSHGLSDTARGAGNWMSSDLTVANIANNNGGVSAFTSTGFSVNTSDQQVNGSGNTYASWTFREQPKFFDIVTYTGTGVARTISHSLGSVPGCIIVKKTSGVGGWMTYHRSTGATQYLFLNTTDAAATASQPWNNTAPTSSVFTVGTSNSTNQSGETYVAYLFAHDAGGFGATGNDNVISCGSWTNTASSGYIDITLGYEPQWLLIKNTSTAENWVVVDNMRNWSVTNGSRLMPNLSDAEATWNAAYIPITSTGFRVDQGAFGASGNTYIYIAIRRGPMKTPTTGTSVFNPNINFSTISSGKFGVTTGFPVDALWWRRYDTVSVSYSNGFMTRLQGNPDLKPYNTAAEANDILPKFDYNTQVAQQAENAGSQIYWSFARAPGFFDVVCYTGNGTNRTINHNLGVAPELIIIKSRSATAEWITSVPGGGWGNTEYLIMNNTFAKNNYGALNVWNGTAPTSTVFSLGTISSVNFGSTTFVAYLFASCPGVSKVGSYTGNGSSQTINCGFTAGARFVMIKRTDSSGDWYVWDTARGMVAGNDPHLSLNTTAANVTTDDSVDTDNSGFIVNQLTATNINVSSATYIYLAIA